MFYLVIGVKVIDLACQILRLAVSHPAVIEL